MKSLILLTTLLFYSSSQAKLTDPSISGEPDTPTKADSIPSVPNLNFSIGSDGFNSASRFAENNFDKRIVQRPKTEVNQYLGDLITSFSIPLPKGFHFLAQLNFKYNSSQFVNKGFGIGFSLDLPELEIDQEEIKILGISSAGVLLPFANGNKVGSQRIQKIISLIAPEEAPAIEYFLNQSGEDSSLYVKFKSSRGVSYAQVKSNGETWLFNQVGLPVRVIGILNKGLVFQYNKHALVGMSDLDSEWNVQFRYLIDAERTQNYRGQLEEKVLGLKSVEVSQGNKKLNYAFKYDGEYLVSVREQGALRSLFQAQYADSDSASFQTTSLRSALSFEKNSSLSYSLENEITWIKRDNKNLSFDVDINGDFFIDRVTLNTDEINSAAQSLLAGYKITCSRTKRVCEPNIKREVLENLLNSIPQKITTFIAVSENGSLVYKEDKTLSLPVNEVKFLQFSVAEKNRIEESEYGNWTIREPKIDNKVLFFPKFVDLDNNGKKDFLICENDNDTKFEKNLTGKFSGERQNPVVLSYFNFITKKDMSIFNEKGNAIRAYYVYTDRNLLKNNFTFNASKIRRVELSSNLPCNQLSLPIDYNKDGMTDLLTGNKITLFNADGTGKSISLSEDELKKIIGSPRADLPIEEHPVELVELKNDGVLNFIQSFGTYTDKTDRALVYLQEGMSFKVHRASPVKLLVQEKTSYGGYSQVDYIYHNGSSLVKEILFSPRPVDSENYDALVNQQPQFKKVYTYEGSRFSDQFNILLGHSKSRESVYLEALKDHQMKLSKFIDTYFDQDFQDFPLFILKRARKNGRILKQEIFEADGTLTSSSSYAYAEKTDLGSDRLYSYVASKKSYVKGQGKGSITTQYELRSPFSPFAFSESHESSLVNDEGIHEINKSGLNQNLYLLKNVSSSLLDANGSELAPKILQSYDSNGLLVLKSEKGITTTFSYDSLGRLISFNDQRGKRVEYKYYSTTPLVSEIHSEGNKQKLDFEFVTNQLLSTKKNEGRTDSYQWSSDGILLSLDRDWTSVYSVKKQGNSFQITQGDIIRTYHLDGFGRVIKVERQDGDSTIIEKAVVYNDNDSIIKSQIAHFGEDFSDLEEMYSYDSLGRLTYNSLIGSRANNFINFSNQYTYSAEGIQTKIEKLGENFFTKSLFQKNERNFTLAHQTANENVSFDLDSLGKIKKVNEIEADYTYDLFGKLNSTQASGMAPWDRMSRNFDPSKNLVITTSGSISSDAYDRATSISNSSLKSKFQKTITYERGQAIEAAMTFNGLTLIEFNTFDSEDRLTKTAVGKIQKTISYDAYDRPVTESIQNLAMTYNYAFGSVSGIDPFVESIEYDAFGKPAYVTFANQASLSFSYDFFKKLEAVQINLNSGKNLGINYNDELNGKVSKLYSSANFYGLSQGSKKYSYDERLYLTKAAHLKSAQAIFNQSNIVQVSGFNFSYENDLLSAISHSKYGSFKNFVSPDKKWQGTCPAQFKSLDECFIKLNSDEYLVQGEYIRAIRVSGKMIGVLYKKEFYPALTDHQDSLIALVSPEGNSLAFERTYNEWGEKTQVVGDISFEKKIPWAFAGLVQHPFFNGEVLQSETRLYVPSLGLWTSADNLVKWNPNALQNLPGNWQPLLYASGDPVNHVDPSGHYSLSASEGAGFSLLFNEQLKADKFEKWNSAEGKAYRKEAIQNLGKVGLVGIGILATAGTAPEIAAGAKLAMAGVRALTLAGTIEYNAARVSVGMFVAKNPQFIEKIVDNSLSLLDQSVFEGQSREPGVPKNTVEFLYFLKEAYEAN